VAETGGPSLRVTDLRKSYTFGPDTIDVLRGITISMVGGDALAIVGPSGSGKSTLLHLLGTLDRPTGGIVEIDGVRPHDLPEPELAAFRNRRIGFVFQDHHLLPQYSVLENVLVPSLVAVSGDGSVARARELLARVGLQARLNHRPGEISGGERQRAAVARALINRPGLLLCDEPTGNLDEAAAASVASLLFELHQEQSGILIVVTHSLPFARRFPRCLRLAEGVCSEA
jgi:lipoprotein-releasing system ATP-binding protein